MTAAVVFEYSQTGQLNEVVGALVEPLADAGWRVRRVAVEPARPYPFPWPVVRFFGVFPDCVDERATVELATTAAELTTEPDEIVILAYQVWYLAPSLPARTLLAGHGAAFADRDVIGVVACRNMWYSAATEVQKRLAGLGARSLGTVAATDTRAQAVTFVTTLRWLLGGARDGRLGRAGVGADELDRIRALGARLAEQTGPAQLAKVLADADAAPVVPVIAAGDLLAGRMFRAWGGVIRGSARFGAPARAAALTGFVAWLGAAIAVGLPSLAAARVVGRERFDRMVRDAVARSLRPAGAVS